MTGCLVLLLAVAPTGPSPGLPDAALLAQAEESFADGVALRHDSVKARPAFARAANAYDELWRLGRHTPALALDRARARELAGDLPGAIAALHEGLAVARWDRSLQVALEEARSRVAYPHTGDLANQCRPAPAAGIGTRMSPLEAWSIATAAWFLMCAAVVRFAMTRARRWLLVAGTCALGLTVLGTLWYRDIQQRERENATPLVIVTSDVYLRKGNAEAWMERLESRLPRGVEARELAQRGGWVQVRLAGGAVGWLPETAICKR